jgi:hypothetical protein
MKRTLKRELKVREIAKRETLGTRAWMGNQGLGNWAVLFPGHWSRLVGAAEEGPGKVAACMLAVL